MVPESSAAPHLVRASRSGRGSGRRLAYSSGAAVLAAAWMTPLPQLAGPGFASQMLVHVLVLAIAAPLIGAALASDPRLMARLPRSLVSPIPAAVFEFAVVWLWHLPILHGLARLSTWGSVAEQGSFFLAGVLLWTTALRPAGRSEGGAGTGVLALIMTSTHLVLLGSLLTLAPVPLYTHAIASLGDVYAELAAQRAGGMIMLLGGGLSCLAGGVYLVQRALRPGPARDAAALPR